MDYLELGAIAVGLAMDAFAVALVCSATLGHVSPRQVFRFAWHFGLFQGTMPVLGWRAGRAVHAYIAAWDHWAAFALLALIGGRAIYEALQNQGTDAPRTDPTRGLSLVMLSLATSIDALAVGVSLAMIDVDIWQPVLVIGLVTCALTTVGMLLGPRLGAGQGRRIEIAGGLILIGIGLKILLGHLLGASAVAGPPGL